MKVKVIKGSANEVFCCSVSKAKETFRGTEVYLNFGYLGKTFVSYEKEQHYNYVKKHIKGKVLSTMSVLSRTPQAILSFYLFKRCENFNELRNEFENKYLPEFYSLYQEQLNDATLNYSNKIILVELLDDKLKLHKAVL